MVSMIPGVSKFIQIASFHSLKKWFIYNWQDDEDTASLYKTVPLMFNEESVMF